MISCQLIQITRTPQGLPVYTDSVISATSIQIGRGAACKIHLMDPRIALLHASISRSQNGQLFIGSEHNEVLKINGFIAKSGQLLPGMHIEIGPYELIVGAQASGYELVLSIELTQAIVLQDTTSHAPLTLSELGISKRKLGWRLAALILFLFMLLPMLPSASSALDKWQSSLPLTLTGAWSPGPLARGHALFSAKCSACHQTPFKPVSDEVCTSCHKQTGRHLQKEDEQTRTFVQSKCTDCHIDHKGAERLVLHDSSKCIACHGDIKKKNSHSALANVGDFTTDHPPFHITLKNGKEIIRLRQDDKVRLFENSGLKYSHQVHLNKEGISTPEGDTVMQCSDCHKLEESGRHFKPMSMQKTCQQSGCHALEFTDPIEGVVPHGSEHAVMDRMREFYAKWLAESPENRAECGEKMDAQGLLLCADKLARKNAAATLFRSVPKSKKDRLECGECHEFSPTGGNDIPWKITSVRINRDWQPGAVFSHNKHEAMNCTDCHDKLNSKRSSDIAIPDIAKCRACHVGKHPVRGKIASGCDSCHRFHQTAHHPEEK